MHEQYESPFHRFSKRDTCWSCNRSRAKTDIGLCGECRDRLIEEGRGGEK